MPTALTLQKAILKHLGIDSLSKDEQLQIVEGLTENILRGIMIAILTKIPEEARPEYRRLKEAGDNIALTQFLQKYIPNLERLVEEETKKCVDEFKQIVGSLKTAERAQAGSTVNN